MEREPNKQGYMVLQFVNSFVGKQGNIGVRAAHVLETISHEKCCEVACVCRGAVRKSSKVEYMEMGWLGHVPRLLNAVRIYIANSFNHRFLDISIYEWFSLRQLDFFLEKKSIDVAHVWDTCPRLIRRLKENNIKVILDVSIAPLTYSQRMREQGHCDIFLFDDHLMEIELTAFKEADLLIAPSAFVAEELVLSGVEEKKIRVVPFGVNNELRKREESEIYSDGGIDYCFLGNVSRRKGVPELLQSWDYSGFIKDRLHLCGRGFPEVKKQLWKTNGGKIITPGFVDAFDYLKCCDVFVLPSWLEGSAKSIYEAMASAIPIITTRASGSVVRDGIDGFLIESGDVKALRERMLWFKENPEMIQVMGRSARERVRDFTWDKYSRAVIELYENICWK